MPQSEFWNFKSSLQLVLDVPDDAAPNGSVSKTITLANVRTSLTADECNQLGNAIASLMHGMLLDVILVRYNHAK